MQLVDDSSLSDAVFAHSSDSLGRFASGELGGDSESLVSKSEPKNVASSLCKLAATSSETPDQTRAEQNDLRARRAARASLELAIAIDQKENK